MSLTFSLGQPLQKRSMCAFKSCTNNAHVHWRHIAVQPDLRIAVLPDGHSQLTALLILALARACVAAPSPILTYFHPPYPGTGIVGFVDRRTLLISSKDG
jgi:hypothetical protein